MIVCWNNNRIGQDKQRKKLDDIKYLCDNIRRGYIWNEWNGNELEVFVETKHSMGKDTRMV